MVTRLLTFIGRNTLDFLAHAGAVNILLGRVLLQLRYLVKDRRLLFDQMLEVGYRSLPLVLMVGIFTGAVTVWQGNYQFMDFLPLRFLGLSTYKAVVLELGPVLTALIIAGRVGASIAAELGTMKVTEQIDALESLAINPVRYLASPRFFASVLMLPVLVIFADFIAIVGGFTVGNAFLGMSKATFFNEIPQHFWLYDIFAGLTKSVVFGGSTAIIGCYIGFNAEGGATGVGHATIQAFVWSCLLILTNDFILATILF
jgi:phospholipid/cholesterol/gamma-HCH transport system permease protein